MRTFEEITEDLDRDGFGHYLAGFLDGEGSFVIVQAHGPKGTSFSCRMQVKLRDDDAAILYEMHERTGLGRVTAEKNYSRSRGADNGKPQITWVVGSKADCAVLVRLLERYPLRAKKSRDFAIWKLAVRERSVKRRYGGWETIAALRAQLVEERRYKVDSDDWIPLTLTQFPQATEEFDLGTAA